jgi:YfiH family protein
MSGLHPLPALPAELPEGVTGFFTTRLGGTSSGVWSACNLALHVEDDPDRVFANRDLLARTLDAHWVNLPQQVHGAGVLVVDAARAGRRRITRGGARGVDALVTRERRTPIGVLVADCLPVLIADAAHGVVAAVHAGRRGLAAGVLQATVESMVASGARPADCVAVIGPAVCGSCYEVPAEMRDDVAARVPGSAATTARGTPSLDLAAGAEQILRGAGLGGVRQTGICTVTDDRFYSYRRDGVTGRFAGVVMWTGP